MHIMVGYGGPAYREAKDKYRADAERDPQAYLRATLAGSMRTDQNRFNIFREFGAIYFSLDRQTPLRELERTYRKFASTANPEDISTPRIMLSFELRLESVADLRNPSGCRRWGVSPLSITGDDVTPCQEVARKIRRTHEAIRWHSATGTGENIAVFFDRLLPSSSVELLGIEVVELPL